MGSIAVPWNITMQPPYRRPQPGEPLRCRAGPCHEAAIEVLYAQVMSASA